MLNMQGCKWRVLSASHSVTIFVLAAVLARAAAMKVARENKSYEREGARVCVWVCAFWRVQRHTVPPMAFDYARH